MTHSTTQSLSRREAAERAHKVTVELYDVSLDLTLDQATFGSRTVIDFASAGGDTFIDLQPEKVSSIRLNGRELSPDLIERGRLPIATEAGSNQLVIDAVMAYRNDGEGLHRSVDPVDGRPYVYGMCFMAAAPSVFACFDQPDLKAPYRLHVRAPSDWYVAGNAPGRQVEPGVWEFDRSQPLSTYFVSLIAGPWHVIRDEHDGIPLALSCRASIAEHLDKDAREILDGTKACFDEFHRLFGIRYPFGDYHQAFVPEFNAGAMENPGLVTFRDAYVFTSKVPRNRRIARMTTIAHEMAHQWFGNLTTPVWWDDLWLNESFAEYMGNRVCAEVTEFSDAWTMNAYARRQWGLTADLAPSTHPVAGNGAEDASSALQDFDGISYAKGSAVLKQLNARLGDDVFFRGVVDHFERHRFGNATMADLFGAWEHAAGASLTEFTDSWLRTAGVDTLAFDRQHGVVQRHSPLRHPAQRAHAIHLVTADPDAGWRLSTLEVDDDTVPLRVEPGSAVVLDPYDDSWAVTPPDLQTARMLIDLLPGTGDEALRAGLWNGIQSAVYDAALDPDLAVRVVTSSVPTESRDDALTCVYLWAAYWYAPYASDPDAALAELHAAAVTRAETAPPGSTLQLAALHGATATAGDPALLRRWLDGRLPAGAELDLDLRWRLLVRLATLGGIDREQLAAALAEEPSAVASVEHLRAVCSLPDAEAKALAWSYFTGETPGSNYELEAAGTGLWRAGQEELTAPYVRRYFDELPATAEVRSGWVLADAARWFFPDEVGADTLMRAQALLQREDVEASLHRRVIDSADTLARRLAIVERFRTVAP